VNKKDLIKSILQSWLEKIPIDVRQRETRLPVDSGKIITVVGVRRCGKTSVLFDTINGLLKSGISKERILFFSFDDERLNLKTEEFDIIIQSYRELHPEIQLKQAYVFFDEIQVADGWEQFVRRIYDSETKNIFISGSNSKMLATDIASSLRGRTLQYEIFPLNFSEYCGFLKLDQNTLRATSVPFLINSFRDLMMKGGFPELALNGYRELAKTLQEYYFVLLYKDIVERYEVKNIPALRYFVTRLLSNLSKPTSINKINNELKTAGYKFDKNLLYSLAEYLENVFFIYRMGRFSREVVLSDFTDKKVYFVDNGMIQALTPSYQEDYGKLFENLVFLWLRRKAPFLRGLLYYKEKKECDFVLFDRNKPELLVQACYNFTDPDTRKREIDGIMEASVFFNCKNLLILTFDHEEELNINNLNIRIVPGWKEMLVPDV
jgi:predicted AAA+ superfamily ATPase